MAEQTLTDAHYREINKGLNALADGRRRIALAEQAGVDMTEYKDAFDNVQRKLEAYKSVYFPDRR